jgi:hypothetical protein
MTFETPGYRYDDPTLAEQEALAAENAAALADPNYIDPWDHLLDLDPDKDWPWIEVPDV